MAKPPQQQRPDIRDTISRVDLVELARKLHPSGQIKRTASGEHAGLCPFHQESTPSFTIYRKGGHQKFKCFGCGAQGDALSFIQQMNQCNPGEALGILNRYLGNTRVPGASIASPIRYSPKAEEALKADDARRAEFNRLLALGLYDEARSFSWDERVASYLISRGLIPSRHLPFLSPEGQLRLHPGLKHPDTGDKLYPCMLAPIRHSVTGEFLAVHRTYLQPDGCGKAELGRAKLVLGPMRSGAIQLFQPDDHLYIAEGIETALSVRQHLPTATVWAGVSLSNLKTLVIPPQVRMVTLLADNDMKMGGDNKIDPRDLIKRYAWDWKKSRPGLQVRIAWADQGTDFNDMMKMMARA